MTIFEEESNDLERLLPPALLFVFFPSLLLLPAILVLTSLPGLLGQYNYLRGARSPIDQIAQELLGSDVPRGMVLLSGIFGIILGLYLSRLVYCKLRTVMDEGSVEISRIMYLDLFTWNTIPMIPPSLLNFWQSVAFGSTSDFLSNMAWFFMAGSFLSYSIPVLIGYAVLLSHADAHSMQIEFTAIQNGRGLRNVHQLTLRKTYSGPET